jgi:hypothetical protein
MNVNLHIERLVLDGLPVTSQQSHSVQAAVETELTRLLAKGGLSDALHSGGALNKVKADGIQLANDAGPTRLGEQIAGAVYGGIGT